MAQEIQPTTVELTVEGGQVFPSGNRKAHRASVGMTVIDMTGEKFAVLEKMHEDHGKIRVTFTTEPRV